MEKLNGKNSELHYTESSLKKDLINLEIERKFRVKKLPENLDAYHHFDILQGYFTDEKGEKIRLRSAQEKYFKTTKKGSGLVRKEQELEITQEEFEKYWPLTFGARVEKTRYKIPYGDFVIELDIYKAKLNGFCSVEVEFKAKKDGKKFKPPNWFGEEVTDDPSYSNSRLAVDGLPKSFFRPELELKDGIKYAVSTIREKIKSGLYPVIIEVAGGSASGKTSAVAAKIKEEFGDQAMIISMDDYYRGKVFMEDEAKKGNYLNWDQPEAIDLDLLSQNLDDLKTGLPINKPKYSFKTGTREGNEEVKPTQVIILEGLFALDSQLKEKGDFRIFVDIGFHGRILRRLLRDIERTGQKPSDILDYFASIVEPMHKKYVQGTRKNSDLVINNEYSPDIEAQNSGLHEIQLKFKVKLDPEILRKAGADRLASVEQDDYYYNPKDRNLIDSGEILRIRRENNQFIFTYKGPKTASKFRKRPKFEFAIDELTMDKFLQVYGDKVKTVKKSRDLYQLDGIVFSIDEVSVEESGNTRHVGQYLEVRATDKIADENQIKKVLIKLGINFDDGIRESYFEM